jgi:hypothetical protein
MFGAIASFISGIFSPAAKLVDEIHTSDEEKMKLRNELARIQESAMSKMMELEKTAMEAQSKVQVAEANSSYWLTANWRPLTSVTIVVLIVLGSFGFVQVGKEIYDLAEIFLGAYAGGRSVEKLGKALKLGK